MGVLKKKMIEISQNLKEAGFVYRESTQEQLEIARKRCPWIFEPEIIIDLREKEGN